MSATLHVTVTADDIGNGEPGEPCLCPIALAVSRALDSGFTAWATTGHVEVDPLTWVDLPVVAQDFIGRYDNALPVEPFEFDLELPS